MLKKSKNIYTFIENMYILIKVQILYGYFVFLKTHRKYPMKYLLEIFLISFVGDMEILA